jgi:hypothetical protein
MFFSTAISYMTLVSSFMQSPSCRIRACLLAFVPHMLFFVWFGLRGCCFATSTLHIGCHESFRASCGTRCANKGRLQVSEPAWPAWPAPPPACRGRAPSAALDAVLVRDGHAHDVVGHHLHGGLDPEVHEGRGDGAGPSQFLCHCSLLACMCMLLHSIHCFLIFRCLHDCSLLLLCMLRQSAFTYLMGVLCIC